jgi:hypothetical protein
MPAMLAINPANGGLFYAYASIYKVHIHFCFNKSKEKFILWKFQSTGHPYQDPIDACVSICCRAYYLGILTEEPLGLYSSTPGTYSSIANNIVKRII